MSTTKKLAECKRYASNAPEIPQEIREGAAIFHPPDQAKYDVLDIVVEVDDELKRPWVVVSMPYWLKHSEGIVCYNAGVNVISLAGLGQVNSLPVECYQLCQENPLPLVPDETRRWIEGLAQ